MIALYMRLSGADGDLDGEKAESNSIANQRKILRDFVESRPELACQETEEFVDDGFSGSSFDRPEVQRMLELCKSGLVSAVIVKDLSRFAREFIDAGTYIEQVFPFLRIRFISLSEGYDSMTADMDRSAPDIAIRNIANAAYCRDTSIRIQTTLHTKWRRGLRPHAMPPFGYMVDPDDPMSLAVDDRFSGEVARVFELASELADPKAVAARLTEEGVDTPGVAFRKHGLYGYDKRPEPKTRSWTTTQVLKIIGNPVYKGTLVAGKTHRKVMSKKPFSVVPESERYITEGAHAALVTDEEWNAAQACMRTKDYLKGVGHSKCRSPFSNGFVVRAECGHSYKLRRKLKSGNFYECACDCANGGERMVGDAEIAAAVAAALRGQGVSTASRRKRPARGRTPAEATARLQLEAYERYVSGAASIEDLRSVSSAPEPRLEGALAPAWLGSDLEQEKGALLLTLEEGRMDDVDRKLLRRLVSNVVVCDGTRLEVVMR